MRTDDELDKMQSWLKKLRRFGTIDKIDYHLAMGRFCHYPDCCIKNFVNFMKLRLPAGIWMEKTLGRSKFRGYVQCVLCRELDPDHEPDYYDTIELDQIQGRFG